MIKNVNGLSNDQIFQKKELLIPVTPTTKFPEGDDALPRSEEEILNDRIKQEEYRRKSAVSRLELYMKARMPNRKIGLGMEDYASEALFYC